ncbi:MAG: CvpA family protein, partial [Victivallales bacterium]|nr:CvpA family protein [Victivallales bacterium]
PQPPQAVGTQQTLPQGPQQNNSLQENIKMLELDENGFNWHRDWWKYVLMALSVVIVAYLTLKVTNMLFRTAIVMLCIGFGIVGSLLLAPVVTPWLANLLEGKLPAFLAPVYIAYALCFLVCYLIATAITNAVGKPGKSKNNSKTDDDAK